jgi:hypothetical protein
MSKLTHGAAYEQFLLGYARRKAAQVRADAASLTTTASKLKNSPSGIRKRSRRQGRASFETHRGILAVKLVNNGVQAATHRVLRLEAAE